MSEEVKVELSNDAAWVYQNEFVPAIFSRWAPKLVAAAGLSAGDRVLDVGCGTGVVAREAAIRTGKAGLVTGIDINQSMLNVAQELAPEINWRSGDVTALPFADCSFDAVTSQFVLMFVADKVAALRELWRVLAPGGTLAFSTWSDSSVYQSLGKYCRDAGVADVADSFDAFFTLADKQDLSLLLGQAGIPDSSITTLDGTVHFGSVEDFIRVEISGWVLADSLDEESYELLKDRAEQAVAPFCNDSGEIVFPMNAHMVTACKVG